MKSYVSNFLELARRIYYDSCAKCVVKVSDYRDLKTIRSRVKREGVSFLTISLPNFCRDFEEALDRAQIDPSHFPYFRKVGAIPELFQGMLGLLFDRETGRLYDNEERLAYHDVSTVIECIRQICLTFKKVNMSCTPAREARAISSFVNTEHELAEFNPSDSDVSYFASVAFVMWNRAFRAVKLDSVVPRHGPGAVAEKLTSNQKFVWQLWHERLEPYFPFLGSGYSISAFDSLDFERVSFVTPMDEQPSRVVAVPKTLKAPRIIAIEAACMQYSQQAIKEVLYRTLESFEVSAGHVNFTDQTINQEMALRASMDGSMSTIDLSEASDRVPLSLVLRMFDCCPDLRDAIASCRSYRADVPHYGVIPLRKFASMGNALTFPIEAMYFYTVCIAGLLKKRELPVTYRNVLRVAEHVFVYGDDIVVPADSTTFILDYLQKYNCKVNAHKTFQNGSFRESCGVDAYLGQVVTPVYVRRLPPENKLRASELISWVETANLLYKKGLWLSADFMFKTCESALGESLPYVAEDSSALGRKSFLGFQTANGWSDRYQCLVVQAWVPEPVYRTDELDDYAALHKSLSNIRPPDLYQGEPSLSISLGRDGKVEYRRSKSLTHSALHGVAALKRRRVPV